MGGRLAVIWAEQVGQAGPVVWDPVFGVEMHGSCRSTRFLMQWWKRG